MAKRLDPRLLEILKKYDESAEDALWDCHGTWVVYHKAVERIAAKAGVWFELPMIVESNTKDRTVAIAVRGVMGKGDNKREEWSFGEASPSNNKNAYPYAMAEKRAKDRVVLKLVGLHGLAYSEEESDDFKPATKAASQPPHDPQTGEVFERAPPAPDETYSPPPRKANGLPEQGWREDGSRTSFWLKKNGTAEELKAQLYEDAVDCHSLKQLEDLKNFYRGKARDLKFNKSFLMVLTEEFAAIERSIMNAMEAAELAEVPLETALKQSLMQHPVNGG